MKKTLIITSLIIIIGIYFQNQSSEELPMNNPKVAEVTQQQEVIPKPIRSKEQRPIKNKKIQKKTPPPPLSSTAKYPQVDKSFAPFDEDGNRYITSINVVGKHLVYHGDVLLGDTSQLEDLKKQKYVKRPKPSKWPAGVIPYLVDENLPNYDDAMEAIRFMDENTNLQFKLRTDEKDYLYLTDGEVNCYSFVGKVGRSQHIFLAPSCRTKEILHELMHSVGFFHEQNREDRDKYLDVFWDNIPKEQHMQFKKIPNDFLGLSGRPFDFKSIMLYPSSVFALDPNEPTMLSKNGEPFLPTRDLLSEEDIARVNIAYP